MRKPAFCNDVMFRQRAFMGAREGRYGCTRGPIMAFESRAISARVTKQIVTIFSKTCDNTFYYIFMRKQRRRSALR